MKKTILVIALIFFCHIGYAQNANYLGVINRIAFIYNDGSFVVTMDSNQLDDCQYKYA